MSCLLLQSQVANLWPCREVNRESKRLGVEYTVSKRANSTISQSMKSLVRVCATIARIAQLHMLFGTCFLWLHVNQSNKSEVGVTVEEVLYTQLVRDRSTKDRGGMPHRRHIDAPSYLAASGCAAVVNFPLWKASAIAQSGFSLQPNAAATASSSSAASATGGRAMLGTAPRSAVTQWLQTYKHAFSPPYRGVATVLIGMTWARAAIFYGSDAGRQWLSSKGAGGAAATVLPPMAISTAVQCINMPIVRASITLQNPAETEVRTTWQALKRVAAARGAAGLWHGTSAGIAKTVPKVGATPCTHSPLLPTQSLTATLMLTSTLPAATVCSTAQVSL